MNFCKTGGDIFQSRGNNIFLETGGKCTETGKIGGKFEKKSSEILADENREIFREKVKGAVSGALRSEQ